MDALVVRGISDRADAAKHDADASGSQQRAAEQAALVTVALLRKHRPREVPCGAEEEPHRGGGGATYGGDHIDFRGGTFHGPVVGKRVDGRGQR